MGSCLSDLRTSFDFADLRRNARYRPINPCVPFVAISIGPVSAESARIWLDGARQTMAVVRSKEILGVPVPVMDAFDRYLDDWSLELSGDVFLWTDRVDQEMLRHLAAHWARLVNIARDQPESGITTAVPAGEAFFSALATGMAEALAVGDDREQFAPRFEEVVPDFLPAERAPIREASRRVMLVDDNADIRMLLRIGLETTGGFSIVAEAGNGQEALDVLDAVACPDVVLLDLSMPVMDGMTALPLLIARCAEARVVIFSAHDSPGVRHEVAAKGGFAFLRKDTAIADIADVLRSPHAGVSA